MSAAGPPVVGLRLTESGRRAPLVYAEPGDLEIEVGDWVIVRQPAGDLLAQVVVAPAQVVESALTAPLPRLIRRARLAELPDVRFDTAGARLLRSLDLPAAACDRPSSPCPATDQERATQQPERQ